MKKSIALAFLIILSFGCESKSKIDDSSDSKFFPIFKKVVLEDYASDSEEQKIIILMKEMDLAFPKISKNPELLYRFYDKKSSFHQFLARRQLYNWKQKKRHIDIHKPSKAHTPSLKSNKYNQRVKISGKMALYTANYTIQSEKWNEWGRSTAVLLKSDKGWKIIHRHNSIQHPNRDQEFSKVRTIPMNKITEED